MTTRCHQSSCEAERKRRTPHSVVNAFRVCGAPLVLDPPLHERSRVSCYPTQGHTLAINTGYRLQQFSR